MLEKLSSTQQRTVPFNAVEIACICLYDIASFVASAMEEKESEEKELVTDIHSSKPETAVQKTKNSYFRYQMSESFYEVLKGEYVEVLAPSHNVSLQVKYGEPVIRKRIKVYLKVQAKLLAKFLSCMAYIFWYRQLVPSVVKDWEETVTRKTHKKFYCDENVKECQSEGVYEIEDSLGICDFVLNERDLYESAQKYVNVSGYKEFLSITRIFKLLSNEYDPTWPNNSPDMILVKMSCDDSTSGFGQDQCRDETKNKHSSRQSELSPREANFSVSPDPVYELRESDVNQRCWWLEDSMKEDFKCDGYSGKRSDVSTEFSDIKGPDCCLCSGIISKGNSMDQRRYGILSHCEHAFCYSCIRVIYTTHTENAKFSYHPIRGPMICPVCNEVSETVAASSRWMENSFQKKVFFEEFYANTDLVNKVYQCRMLGNNSLVQLSSL